MTAEGRMLIDDQRGDLVELLSSEDRQVGLAADVKTGLTSSPKRLPPKYFYDDIGSELFEQITRLPEYYPTRAEYAILTRHAREIAQIADAEVLLELGSGASAKTRALLDAMASTGSLTGYVPVDVSSGALREALPGLRRDYPGVAVHAVVADIETHLGYLPAPGRRLFAFLGSTIGNFPPTQRSAFLSRLAASMNSGEALLLGVDLVKEPARLLAAYDDADAVTAQFNRNVLHVLNREMGADFQPTSFDHVAVWDADNEWIEMRLRAQHEMQVRLAALDLSIDLEPGEEILTEISAKFRRSRVEQELTDAGLVVEGWWTDEPADFALALARR